MYLSEEITRERADQSKVEGCGLLRRGGNVNGLKLLIESELFHCTVTDCRDYRLADAKVHLVVIALLCGKFHVHQLVKKTRER